jgi:hypothetical protein
MNEWVKRDDVETGERPSTTKSEHKRVKEPEREVKKLHRANEIQNLDFHSYFSDF